MERERESILVSKKVEKKWREKMKRNRERKNWRREDGENDEMKLDDGCY